MKKSILVVMALVGALLVACEKEPKPNLTGIPKIEMLSGIAYVHFQEFRVRINKDTKAGFNAYNLPKEIFIECQGPCQYRVNGSRVYEQSKLFQL